MIVQAGREVEERTAAYARRGAGYGSGMAVDITLVLRSEHRRLRQLIDRCGRPRRGFGDPVADLRAALRAHVGAASTEVYPLVPADDDLDRVRALSTSESWSREALVEAAEELIAVEQKQVVGVLAEAVEPGRRRRMGKAFRMRRDALLRRAGSSRRRHRSQTELYELARRAGVAHRSNMTQAQLEQALEMRGITDPSGGAQG